MINAKNQDYFPAPNERSFRRFAPYIQANIINRAQALGMDYISLYQAEEARRLDSILPSKLSCSQNLDNCTTNVQCVSNMPFSEGADEMLRRQKLKINGQEKWITFSSTQELIDLVQREFIPQEYEKNFSCSGFNVHDELV